MISPGSSTRPSATPSGHAAARAFWPPGLATWAVVLTTILIWLPSPLASVIPLLVLATTFEVVRVLHLVVERIGRYIQVFHEETVANAPLAPPAWERAAMQLGPSVPGA